MRCLPLLALALLVPTAPATARDEVPVYALTCAYQPVHGEMTSFADCAALDAAGNAHLSPAHLTRLPFNRDGLAEVHVDGGWYYFLRDGTSAPVMAMDNGADPFSGGLARSEVNGKVGFIDRTLNLIIPRRYDGAFPFEKGTAAVCIGCSTGTVGEHGYYAGGAWTCLDRDGRELAQPRALARYEGAVDLCRRYRTSR